MERMKYLHPVQVMIVGNECQGGLEWNSNLLYSIL